MEFVPSDRDERIGRWCIQAGIIFILQEVLFLLNSLVLQVGLSRAKPGKVIPASE
jgi:hypothetical protein